jgi:hypothetical protein
LLRNGKTVCNACNLVIDTTYQKYVCIQRPETAGLNPNDFVHVHNRNANDCWSRVRKTAQIHAASKKRLWCKLEGNGDIGRSGSLSYCEWAQAASAAFHNSDIVAFRPPSVAVL